MMFCSPPVMVLAYTILILILASEAPERLRKSAIDPPLTPLPACGLNFALPGG